MARQRKHWLERQTPRASATLPRRGKPGSGPARTAGGRVAEAGKGDFAGGQAPYGYERDLAGGLRVAPAQARIVRRIFGARRRKATLKAIAEALSAEGIRAPKGGRWAISTVAYVTDNPKYRGAIEYLFRWNGGETHGQRPGTDVHWFRYEGILHEIYAWPHS